MEAIRGMRKNVVRIGHNTNHKSSPARQRGTRNVSGNRSSSDFEDFEDLTAQKPAYSEPTSVLPFLEERIAFRVPSDLRYLDGVIDYLSERLVKIGLIKPEDSEVLIALDEAIVNAIKHGNKCNPHKAVQIVAEMSAAGARFTITDEGAGFVKDDVPDPTDPSRLLEPSGRGLLLINHIMDEVCHNKCGNQIQMFKRGPGECAPDPSKTEKVTIKNQE
jgi:serine/threonine-protein kinase RsbW